MMRSVGIYNDYIIIKLALNENGHLKVLELEENNSLLRLQCFSAFKFALGLKKSNLLNISKPNV